MADQDDELAERLAHMSDAELKALGASVGINVSLPDSPQPVEESVESLPPPEPEAIAALDIKRGSDLEETPPEPADLGLEPGDYYMGHRILRDLPPQDPRHEWLFGPEGAARHRQPFYVLHSKGEGEGDAHRDVIGLVPWLGSTVIWPWEKAWEQDLFHEKKDPKYQAIFAGFRKADAERAKKK